MKKIILGLFLLSSLVLAKDLLLNKDVAKTLMPPHQYKAYEDSLKLLEESKEKKLTIFYLTSTNLVNGTKSFNRLIKKLKDKGEEVYGLSVLRGFPEDKEFYDFLMSAYEQNIGGEIKVHPKIFKTFKITRVPAFVLSYCPTGNNFAFAECENKFVATGDITLTDFFKMVSNKDKTYEKDYFKLIEAK